MNTSKQKNASRRHNRSLSPMQTFNYTHFVVIFRLWSMQVCAAQSTKSPGKCFFPFGKFRLSHSFPLISVCRVVIFQIYSNSLQFSYISYSNNFDLALTLYRIFHHFSCFRNSNRAFILLLQWNRLTLYGVLVQQCAAKYRCAHIL